jgi:hypothetical protein
VRNPVVFVRKVRCYPDRVLLISTISTTSIYKPRQRDRQVSESKINELLSERHQRFTPLQRLLRQAANQKDWTAQLRAVLPGALANDCEVSDVRGSVIVVTCRNASAATKLRFMAPDILEKLGGLAGFHDARELRIRVSARL